MDKFAKWCKLKTSNLHVIFASVKQYWRPVRMKLHLSCDPLAVEVGVPPALFNLLRRT